MALTADRNTDMRDSTLFEGPIAASKECFVGALLVRDTAGNIEPATAAASKIAVGRCEEYVKESTGVAAAKNVKYRAGCFKWKNSSSNALTKAHIGDTVYIEDDEIVGSSASATSAAGIMTDIDSDGVWVMTDSRTMGTTGLLAANNLSDVGTAATARTNLGLGTGDSPTFTGLTVSTDSTLTRDAAVGRNATVAGTLAVTGVTTCTAQANLNGGARIGGTTAPVRKFVRKSLTATQIRKLNATPIELVAAVAGHQHVPISAYYKYTHVANVYDSVGAGEDFRIQWETGTVQALQDMDTSTDINMGAGADDQCHVAQIAKSKPVTNDKIEVTVLTGELAAADADVNGDGTMVIDLVYDDYTV